MYQLLQFHNKHLWIEQSSCRHLCNEAIRSDLKTQSLANRFFFIKQFHDQIYGIPKKNGNLMHRLWCLLTITFCQKQRGRENSSKTMAFEKMRPIWNIAAGVTKSIRTFFGHDDFQKKNILESFTTWFSINHVKAKSITLNFL